MKYFLIIFFLTAKIVQAQNTENNIPNEILIQLKPNASIDNFSNYLISNNIHISNIRNISNRFHIWLITFNDDIDNVKRTLQIANAYYNTEIAQYNHRIYFRNTVPDDPYFSSQWNLLNDGSSGIEDADIDADEAWDITTGGLTQAGDTIVIAIIDDGFDLNHVDLSYWKNYDEINGNGIDDDANGFIDDGNGWNSSTHSGTITSMLHGTHVSGIAGALGNNGYGVVGVNWNVKIMPVQCNVVESEVIEAYDYIYRERELYNNTNGEEGSFIVATNSSFGIDAADPADYPLWCAMYDSLGSIGILSATATTNDNIDVDVVGDMPTACSSNYMISVTNTNKFDQLISGGYGATTIDIGAPGTSIYSTVPGNGYTTQTGTSMSAPQVAGAVSLLMSAACFEFLDAYKTNPAEAILIIKQYILEGVDTLIDLTGITVSNGRLNLNRSLLMLQEQYCFNAIENAEPEFLSTTIFPNPAHDKIYFTFFDASKTKTVSFVLYNALGEMIIYDKEINIQKLLSDGISISHLVKGTYCITIQDKNGARIFSSPVIIQ